jgi:hypothetical protein
MYLLVSLWRDTGDASALTIDDDGAVEMQFLDPPRAVRGHLMPPPAAHEDLWHVIERAARWAAVEAEKS